MRRKNIISICLVLCLSMFSGCGESSGPAGSGRIVELRDPQGKSVGTETVIRRDLFEASVFEAVVYPWEEKHSYEIRQTFSSYGPMAGETVESGEVLLYVDQESMLNQIENLEERLQTLTENFEEYRVEAEEVLAGDYWYRDYYQRILDNLEKQEPEEYITGANGQQVYNSAYSTWMREWNNWDGQYNANELDISTGEEALRQRRELYELDYNYYNDQLQELKAQVAAGVLTSGLSGEVVSLNSYEPGAGISADTTVVVVGDMNRKVLKCEHDAVAIRTAREVYAFINGKRYEVTTLSTEVTDRTLAKAVSTFLIEDENNEIAIGDYGAIVMVKNFREQVLAVPSEVIYVDSTGRFVYVVKDGEAVATTVKVGMNDGTYAEILSGLEEGDEVIVSRGEKRAGENTAVLTKGNIQSEFARYGELYFPKTVYMTNPIKNADVFFVEYHVAVNQYVEEGDVIASVRVAGDEIVLAQKENELKRAKERLADLIAQNNEANEEAIAQRQESIAELEEEVVQMRLDFSTTEIRATTSGIILEMANYMEDDPINSGARLLLMAEGGAGYLQVQDTTGILNYGNMLEVIYTDTSRTEHTTQGRVVSLGKLGVSGQTSEYKLIEIDESVIESVEPVYQDASGRFRKTQMRVIGYGEALNDVILVPKQAVTEKDGATYVDVLNEDGTVTSVRFLAGGQTTQYYWVIDGLTEGMTICWE